MATFKGQLETKTGTSTSDILYPKTSVDQVDGLPTPTSSDNGKFLGVSSGAYALVTGGSGGMTNPMTTANDIIIGGSGGTPARLGKGSNNELLGINSSGNIAYGKNLPILTTAPSSANTGGGAIIVILSSEPSTKYSGYLYVILG